MVFPESPETKGPTGNPRLRLLGTIGAAIFILGAMSVLGRLTTPPPEAEPTPSSTSTTVALSAPTTTSPFPEQGVPFEWHEIVELDHRPVAVHEIGSRVLVYGFGPMGRGAEVWSKSELYRGYLVIDTDHYVQSIVATSTGLLAIGSVVSDGSPVVWNSSDGIDWVKTPLPTGDLPGSKVAPFMVHASDDLILVHGYVMPGDTVDYSVLYAKAESAMRARFGELLETYYWELTGSGVEFNAYGPFGLFLGSATAGQLGLDPTEFTGSEAPYLETLWVSADGVTWAMQVPVRPHHLEEIFTGPDGGLWAMGERGLMTTDDGVDWRPIPTTRSVGDPVMWSQRILALSSLGYPLISSDGTNWEQIEGPDGFFGGSRVDHWATMAGGPYGLAVLTTRSPVDEVNEEAPQRETTLLKIEGNVELWIEDAEFVVRRDGEVALRISTWTRRPGFPLFDLAVGTITFSEPGTDRELITITAAELRDRVPSEQDDWQHWDPGDIERAIFFTPDLSDWTVQALTTFDDRQIHALYVFGDSVVLVTGDRNGSQVLQSSTP